jgi:hypothetical protein
MYISQYILVAAALPVAAMGTVFKISYIAAAYLGG